MSNRPSHPFRMLVAVALAAVVAAGACSSDKKSPAASDQAGTKNSISNSPGTAKAATASAPSPPAAATTQTVTTDDGNHYTVTVTPKAPNTNATCAGINSSGHIIIPFTVTVKNNSGKEVPQPKLGFAISDAGNTQPEVVAVSIPPVCIDFILAGEKLAPNAVATYEGSISNATPTTKLTVNVNNNGPGTAPNFPVQLFAGSK